MKRLLFKTVTKPVLYYQLASHGLWQDMINLLLEHILLINTNCSFLWQVPISMEHRTELMHTTTITVVARN